MFGLMVLTLIPDYPNFVYTSQPTFRLVLFFLRGEAIQLSQ